MDIETPDIDINVLRDRIQGSLYQDRHYLNKALRRLNDKRGQHQKTNDLNRFLARLEKSEKTVERRLKSIPSIHYPDNLPISAKTGHIAEAIQHHQVIVITGETGSGKTTQIPKICLDAGRGRFGKIACTQPRRIAATSLAAQVSKELRTELGQQVGFKIRFADKSSDTSLIQFVTDGILLSEIQSNRFLNQYDTIIIDEAHERTLNIDFLLGYLKQLLTKRPELKLIITSATIDVEKFAEAFPLIETKQHGWIVDPKRDKKAIEDKTPAPIIKVSGRSYPVEIRYRPIDESSEEQGDITIIDMIQESAEELLTETNSGDVLIFVSGIQEIREVTDRLSYLQNEGFWVLPLFGRLSAGEQNRIFLPSSQRKIIVSTNIAETSITVPGIRYVIDTGRARISEYNSRSGTKGLPIKAISQSSANQRSGRCGRVAAGICVRLYSKEDFEARSEFAAPEIQRSDLAEVILRMLSMKLGSIQQFPFIDPPESAQIRAGYRTLKELGALTDSGKLNAVGKEIATLPVDARTARMIIQAKQENALYAVLVIASAISCQDPKERPEDKQAQADQKHALFASKKSDLMSLLNLWEAYHTKLDEFKSQGKMRKFCKSNFLSYKRMREWRDIHKQLTQMVQEKRWNISYPDNWDHDAIHRSILSGYLSNLAKKKEKKVYEGTKNRELVIFPGSGVYKNRFEWIVAIELIETSRLFAHRVAEINVDWLEALGGDLCKKHWFEPHWDSNTSRVAIWEKVTLFGFPIVEKRRVSFGKINPLEATGVFIREALVAEQLESDLPFWKHNQKLKADIRKQEDQQRKRGLLVDDYTIEKFYQERISDVSSLNELKHLIKEKNDDRFLYMSRTDLLREEASEEQFLYPDTLKIGGKKHNLTYSFDPGHPNDGVTISLPWSLLSSLKQESFDRLVPGLLREKILFLLKNLPKETRKKLFPIQEIADRVWDSMVSEIYSTDQPTKSDKPAGNFYKEFSDILFKLTKVDLESDIWQAVDLPDYLRMNFRTKPPGSKKWVQSRSLTELTGVTKEKKKDDWAALISPYIQPHITQWNFGDLLEKVRLSSTGDIDIWGYRALSHQDDAIMLTIHKTRKEAENASAIAVAKLLQLETGKELSWLYTELRFPPETVNQFENLAEKSLALSFASMGNTLNVKRSKMKNVIHKQLQDHVFEMACGGLTLETETNILTAQAYEKKRLSVQNELKNLGGRLVEWITSGLATREEVLIRLQTSRHSRLTSILNDLHAELDLYFPVSCFNEIPLEQWKHIQRLMKCYLRRIDKWESDREPDSDKVEKISRYFTLCVDLKKQVDLSDIHSNWAYRRLLWMFEELKVSIFAQDLKTAFPISEKRIDKFIEKHFKNASSL